MASNQRPMIRPADFMAIVTEAADIEPEKWLVKNGVPFGLLETLVDGNEGAMLEAGDQGLELRAVFFAVIATTFVIGWKCGVQFGSTPQQMPATNEDK